MTTSEIESLADPPESQLTSALFKHCMDFTLSSSQFMQKTEELRRVGINAQVLAAHSGNGGRVLGTLVSEIGNLTGQIAPILEELSSSGAQLARSAIATTTSNQRLARYQSAWRHGLDPRTQARLAQVYADDYRGMTDNFGLIRRRLSEHASSLSELRRCTVFIPALISLLNITVADFADAAQQFHVTAQELDTFRVFILHTTDSMMSSLKDALRLVDQLLLNE